MRQCRRRRGPNNLPEESRFIPRRKHSNRPAMLYVEIGAVILLIVINGLLAMSELSIVSSRPARLKAMADRSVRGAGRALKLSADPGRFLSTVQIGITLVGVFSGAFSGATLGQRLGETLIEYGVPYRMAGAIGVGIVVAL